MNYINITNLIKHASFGTVILTLGACGVIAARLAEQPVERVTGVEVTQACDAPQEIEKRLSGAFLRQSSAAGQNFVPVLITGRENANGLAPNFTFTDEAQTQEVEGIPGTVFQGPRKATSKEIPGFGTSGSLPNVYDITYGIGDITFSGPLVTGPGAFIYEVPSSGDTVFSGRIAVTVIRPTATGETETLKAKGQFAMRAGYGSARASFTATNFDAALPFDTLNWSNLFLCGTRFVSSGKGVVTVQKADGPALSPFKLDRAPAALTAVFESSLLATRDRPAPPAGFGGVFVIQSDNGTMTAVFLSDQPPELKEEDADA